MAIPFLEAEKEEMEKEISDVAAEAVKEAETNQIIPAIKKLDEDEGYDIVEGAGLEEEGGE